MRPRDPCLSDLTDNPTYLAACHEDGSLVKKDEALLEDETGERDEPENGTADNWKY